MDVLFMIEVLVDKIIFASLPVPPKKNMVINATCGSIANLEIRSDVMGAIELQERDAKRKDVEIGSGRSLVFIISPDALKDQLHKYPMEVSISTKLEREPMCSTRVPWNDDYFVLIDDAKDAFGYVSPVYTRGMYQLQKQGKIIATAEIFIRLTYLGKSITTHIQIVDGKTPDGFPTKQFLFKSMDNATTFQCQKFGIGSDTDVAPIGPVYGAMERGSINVEPPRMSMAHSGISQKSTETIMGRDDTRNFSMQSIAASVFDVSELNNRYDINSMFSNLSTVSTNQSVREIRAKRIENLFLDFRDLWNTVSTLSAFDREPPPLSDSSLSSGGSAGEETVDKPSGRTRRSIYIPIEKLDYKTLSVKEIEKRLCKHPDCPAAKLFKDYGIGPLANGSGLGGMYNEVEAPITYGLSHLNGRIDGYGPLGTYSRPKRPEMPFEPPKKETPVLCSTSGTSSNNSWDNSDPMRLRGGDNTQETVEKCENCDDSETTIINIESDLISTILTILENIKKFYVDTISTRDQVQDPHTNIISETNKLNTFNKLAQLRTSLAQPGTHPPMRLRGGGPLLSDTGIPDPLHACQDLMDEFNRLLKSYKDALGPCGTATCPFSYNVTQEACRKACTMELEEVPCKHTEHNTHTEKQLECTEFKTPAQVLTDAAAAEAERAMGDIAGCGMVSCPYKREMITPADKDHKRTQSKAGCGSPICPYMRDKLGLPEQTDIACLQPCAGTTCPFQLPDDLPPIHWDCPDPLPKGDCKNPNCPLVKKDQLLSKYFPKPNSPCHSPACPYATVPCTFPGCPFADPEPCPPSCPYTEPPPKELVCTPSICPFAERKPEAEICDFDDCPYKKYLNLKSTSVATTKQDRKNEESQADCKISTGMSAETIEPLEGFERKQSSKRGSGNVRRSKSKQISEPCVKETCQEETCYGSSAGGGVGKGEGPTPLTGGTSIMSKLPSAASAGQFKQKSRDEVDTLPDLRNEASLKKVKSVEEKALAPALKGKKSRKKRKKKTCYVYDEGTYYPGLKIGHRECIIPTFMVPPDMGWLWNIHTKCLNLRPRRGWKPGAIGRTIAAMIDEHRKKFGLKPITPEVNPNAIKKRKKRNTAGGVGVFDYDSSDTTIPPRPTLQVKKKDGIVYVTMNPLKDPKTLEDNENPYMDCSPMQFKITPSKPHDDNLRNLRMCYCGEDGEEEEIYSASSSELDIEFTPPAGIIRPERLRRKKNVAHVDTQYNVCDLPTPEPPPPQPLQLKKSKKKDSKTTGGGGGGGGDASSKKSKKNHK